MLFSALCLLAGFRSAFADNIISLNGDGWTLTSPGNDSINVPAHVPSQNYIDLHAAGVVADPVYGYEEDNQAWVRYSNWTYTSPAINGLTNSTGISQLVFAGLDGYATVSLCGQQIGTTDNQYIQWIFDITSVLASCQGDIKLELNFGPAQNITHAIGRTANDTSTGNANFADGCSDELGHEFSCKALARKEQSDFGWDWSPHLVPTGPWRNISIVQVDQTSLYVNNALIDVYRQGQQNNLPPDQSQPWIFNASLDFVGSLPSGSGLSLDLTDAGGNNVLSTALEEVYSNNMTITGHTTIDPSKVDLWWPNGMGSQTLYTAQVTITQSGSNSNSTSAQRRSDPGVAAITRRLGFRTIVLNLTPISDSDLAKGVQPGSNWHFEINGEPFYAKGSNLVPVDVLWASVNTTHVHHLFELAKDAHFNMFRVWASGVYQDDSIYDLADEMGILLWSEFEFTDAEYPASPKWEAVYEREAYYNVRRVNHHPSLALWAGGNELEGIQLFYFFDPKNPNNPPSEIMADYQQTFERTLIKCVYANSKSVSYIPSSTYNGYLSLDFDSDRPQLPRYYNTSGPEYLYKNTDFYNDGAKAFNITDYPIGRLANEFGFISMPGIESWDNTGEGITQFTDPIVVYHNRHVGGTFGETYTPEEADLLGIAQMTDAVHWYYPAPALSDARANFSAWIWSSQVFQADHYTSQIAFYRRGSGRPERQLGALYWQFNDVWVAPTWSSVASNLKAKITQYAVKDIFTPVIVRPYYNLTDDSVEIWVTSDRFDAVDGTVEYEWMTWSGQAIDISLGDNSTNSSGNSTSSTTSSTSNSTSSSPPSYSTSNSTSNSTSSSTDSSPPSYSTSNSTSGSTSISPTSSSSSSPPSYSSPSNSTGSPVSVPVHVEPVNSTFVLRWDNIVQTLESKVNVTDIVMRIQVTTNDETYTSYYHPLSLSNATLVDPGLTLTLDDPSSNTFTVQATSGIAAWVGLDYSAHQVQGYWSANGFWLAKGEKRSVTFTVWNDWTGDGSWTKGVTVRSLWDNVAGKEYAATIGQ